ncbi:MAG: hypothetical protein ACI35R_08145 [Bacillus sp. (in: firmicutes)]
MPHKTQERNDGFHRSALYDAYSNLHIMAGACSNRAARMDNQQTGHRPLATICPNP